MKRRGKGFWIAAVVVLIMAAFCLIDGDFQAFGGGLLIAAVLAFFAVRKGKKQKDPKPSPAAQVVSVSADPVPETVMVHADLDFGAETFGCWDVSIHATDGQDVRFDRAMFQHIDILGYDSAAGVAQIVGTRGGTYETTLDSCTCEDFSRRKLPCKHIYKLALSRGYSPDAFFSTRPDVVWYADGCRVYHFDPDCRGLRNRYARRTTVALAEFKGLRPCKSCSDE